MATATKQAARWNSRTGQKAGAQVKGTFVAQRQEGGQWVTCTEDTYRDEQYRRNALAEHERWVNSAPAGSVRRVVEHCTVDGKPRHIIRAESMQGEQDGEPEFPDHDAEALRQFLADETGLAWRVYNVQGVDYTPPSVQ